MIKDRKRDRKKAGPPKSRKQKKSKSLPGKSAKSKSYKKKSPAGTGGRKNGRPQKGASRKSVEKRLTGELDGNARGFGFLKPEKKGEPDVFIPAPYMKGALHGDRVEADVYSGSSDEKPRGKIRRIIEPCRTPVIGHFSGSIVVPRDPRFCAWVRIRRGDERGAEPGQIVVAEVVKRGKGGVFGKVIEVLGIHHSPGIESRISLRAHGFFEEFPPGAYEEALKAPKKAAPSDREGREDLRELFTVTIDPESARDFDDALSIQKTEKGYRLWVSIADVSHYVPPGSDLDLEAYDRGTSVYLPDRAVPMLPPELSSGICSLKPRVDRLAMTVEMDFDHKGKRARTRMYPAIIKSDHRLTYDQVELMEDDPAVRQEFEEVWPHIEKMKELASLLRQKRMRRGAIDLDVPEPEVVLDHEGEVLDIKRREQTWSHQLVEEFMLAANESVAAYMTDRDQPMVYRIHEPPEPAAALALAEMLAPLGFRLFSKDSQPERVRPRDFQRVINRSKGHRFERMVKMLCLRSMMQARYSARLEEHFGLASQRYTHFTSPIRRYPDLVVHRLLKLAMGEELPGSEHVPPGTQRPAPQHLPAAASHCSERERAAEAAEREMVDLCAVLWIKSRLGNEFEGTISGVTPFGLFVELDEAMVEGLIPVEDLDDEAEFDERRMAVNLKTRGETFRLGDRVRVWAESVDHDKRRIKFGLIGPAL